MTPRETNNLRSQRWQGNGPYSFAPRSRTLQKGLTDSGYRIRHKDEKDRSAILLRILQTRR